MWQREEIHLIWQREEIHFIWQREEIHLAAAEGLERPCSLSSRQRD